MSKVISIAIPKGGVGKTTTAVNLAACLAAAEKKTLLIDMDPAGSCSVSLGIENDKISGDIFDVLNFHKSIPQVIQKTELTNLDFVPSKILNYQDEERLSRLSNNVSLLNNIIQQQLNNYKFIIIDTPPYLKGSTSIALAASHSVIIPIKSGNYSLMALKKMINYILWIRNNHNVGLKIEGILHTIYEPNTKASIITENRLYKKFGKYVFNSYIPKNSTIPESTYYGKPAVLFDAKSKGAESYLRLSQEIIIRNKPCPILSIYPTL